MAWSELLSFEDSKERRIGAPNSTVCGKEDLEGTEDLELFLARTVIPVAIERPEMHFFDLWEIGIGDTALALFPEEEIEGLLLDDFDLFIVPRFDPEERPQEPAFFDAFVK